MKTIAKNYFYNFIYQIIVLLIPLFMTPYVSRTLGATQLGIYDYCYAMASLLVTFGLLGMGNYGNREIAYVREDKVKLTETFWRIMVLQLLLGVIVLSCFLYLCVIIPQYTQYLFAFCIFIIASCIDCTWVYVGLEQMQLTVLKNTLAKILFVAGVLLLVKKPSDLLLYIILNGLSILIANLLAYGQLKHYIGRITLNKSKLWLTLKGTIALFLPVVATQILLYIDKIVLGTMGTGIEQVAYYGNAEKIIQIPLSLVTVMNTVMMPRLANEFYQKNKENIHNYLYQASSFSLFLAAPLMVGIFAISDYLIPWFLGSSFSSSIFVVKVLSPLVIGNTLIGISGNQYFVATNRVKLLFWSNILSALTNIVLDILLIPRLGLFGVCLATIFSMTVSLIIQYYFMNKELSITPILINLGRYLLISIIMGMIITVPFLGQQASWKINVVQILFGILTYFILNYITKDKIVMSFITAVKEHFK